MELRPGYKQTEAGFIPEEWEVRALGELASIQRGASPRPIDSPAWFDDTSGIGWVRISDIADSDGHRLLGTRDYLSPAGVLNSRFLPSGTLIMSICATVGVPIVTGIDACIHDGFVGFQKLKHVDQRFLYYKLKEAEATFQGLGQTGSQLNLNTDLVCTYRIALPPLPEQRAIAAALADADDLVAGLDRQSAKARDVKLGAMQALLTGNTRLPGFTEPWATKVLGDVADIIGGGTPSTSVPGYWNGSVAWCTPSDVTAATGKYLDRTERTVTPAGLASSGATLLPADTVLLCTRATVGAALLARFPVATNQGFQSVVPKPSASGEFLYYLVLTLKDKFVERASGSTFLEIGRRDVAATTITVPALPEQRAIAAVLADHDAEIAALDAERAKAVALKRGMMQELLTGRTRLA